MGVDGARPVGFDDAVDAVLTAIGSADGSAGSGSAALLALAAGIQCLALHVELSERREEDRARRAALAALRGRLDTWRGTVRRAFAEDGAAVARFIAARRRRDESPADDRVAAVQREVSELDEATARLLELIGVCRALAADAERMLGGLGARHARSESVTAKALGEAAALSLSSMVDANVETLAHRCREYDVGCEAAARLRAASEPYEPIDCSIHDRLEDAATRGRACRVRYRTPDGKELDVTTTVEDVWARDGAEFVRLGTGAVVRLDHLGAVDV